MIKLPKNVLKKYTLFKKLKIIFKYLITHIPKLFTYFYLKVIHFNIHF